MQKCKVVNLESRRTYMREYKRRNRDKLLARRRELYALKHPKKIKEPIPIEVIKLKKAEMNRRYVERHRIKVLQRKRDYYHNNKEKIHKRFLKEYHCNINKHIACNLRNRLGRAVRLGFKAGSAVRDLGCGIPFFKKYIEERFQKGMSWKNWGKWHLDHIIPLKSFNLSNKEEFLKACHYTNYQPLWSKDNLRKNKYFYNQNKNSIVEN